MIGTTELPVGVIIRTPPGSPSGRPADITPLRGHRSSSEHVISVSQYGASSSCQGDLPDWNVATAHLRPAQASPSRFLHLRENIPFNRFVSELLSLGKLPLTDLGSPFGTTLTRLIEIVQPHSLLIAAPAERTWIPGPRLFGSNPSLDMLARVTFHLSNNLEINWMSDDNSWFLHWFGVSADFTMLKAFFSIKALTVCAAYETLCSVVLRLRRSAAACVLFEIRDILRKSSIMIGDGINFLEIAAEIGSNADGMVNVAQRALKPSTLSRDISHLHRGQCPPQLFALAAARRDIAMMRTLVEALGDCHDEAHPRVYGPMQLISLTMRQVYAWDPQELKDGHTLADYIQLLVQSGILVTTLSPRCCYDDRPKVAVSGPSSITIDELIMFCPPMKRKALYSAVLRWSNEHRMFLNNAGVFTAALEGAQGLLDYLCSCEQNDAFEVCATMQECLLFAASLNDLQTTSSLIQLGVDPEVGLLSNNQQWYHRGYSSWDPIIVAAAAGNLETLNMLKDTIDLVPFLKSAPVHEIIHVETQPFYGWEKTGRELRRLEHLRRYLLYSQTTNSHAAVASGAVNPSFCSYNGDICPARLAIAEKRRIETIIWIRSLAAAHGMGSIIDNEITEAALLHDPKNFGFDHRPVAYDIYHPCDVLLLNGLVDGNLEYHEDDMDLLQLSIRAQCSLAVVELLLSKGLRVHSRAAAQSGNTMLHDALLGQSYDRSKIVHLLLREGADYKRCGGELTILEASLHRQRTRGEMPFPGYLEVFTHLFEAGAPVQHKPRPQLQEWQPLICRSINAGADDDLILRVIDAGADLNERGCVGDCRPAYHEWTMALPAAILDEREKLAQQLIQRGADIHAPAGEKGGFTALQAACFIGSSFEFVEDLVKVQGANVNEAPSEIYGRTALQQAACSGLLSLAEFLLDNGADVNALSGIIEQGRPPHRQRAVDVAAQRGRLDMVEFLLKAGGRSGTNGLDGAIDLCKRCGHFAVLSVLQDWQKKHGRRIMEEEVEWQRRHPDVAGLLLEL